MSTGTRLKRETARQVAERLTKLLDPVCERLEVAGSLRRQEATVGDIELVCIPKVEHLPAQMGLFGEKSPGETVSQLDKRLAHLIAANTIVTRPPGAPSDFRQAWGDRYKKVFVTLDGLPPTRLSRLVQVDLFITTPESWGAIFVIRTGPAEFSHDLVSHILYRTPYRQQDGLLVRKDGGTVVPTPEEEDYFKAVGLLYVPPEKRSHWTIQQLRAAWVRPKTPGESPIAVRRTDVQYGQAVTTTEWLRGRLLDRAGLLA